MENRLRRRPHYLQTLPELTDALIQEQQGLT